MPSANESQNACAPSRSAVSRAPAPTARVTCDVVPYARKLNIAKTPPSDQPGGTERRELRRSEMADDRRVDEDEGRLCGERPEREDGEAKDLAVVRRAPQCGDHSISVRYAAR